jgi:hypothetical protein
MLQVFAAFCFSSSGKCVSTKYNIRAPDAIEIHERMKAFCVRPRSKFSSCTSVVGSLILHISPYTIRVAKLVMKMVKRIVIKASVFVFIFPKYGLA